MIKNYILATKPAIVAGNLVSTAGGFLLASKGNIDAVLLAAVLLGVALVIASGCVFNNIIDRDIDQLMERTKARALATNSIPLNRVLAYGSILGLLGFFTIYFQTNKLATGLLLLGFIVYVGLYSLYFKRNSVYGTFIGSIAGATPPVVGYCAVSHQLDVGAILLFIIFGLWQMPHSYAIAIYRLEDYKAAAIPVLPAKVGIPATRIHIIAYILLFTLASSLLTLAGYTGFYFLAVLIILGLNWLYIALFEYSERGHHKWAKKIFALSIVIVFALNIMMALDYAAYNRVVEDLKVNLRHL